MTASAGAATAALEELGAGVPDETAEAQAAIVIVSRNRGVRQVLHRELSKRYGGDYQIVACGQPGADKPRDLGRGQHRRPQDRSDPSNPGPPGVITTARGHAATSG